ncbi:oxidoreductase [Tardiphaga sp. vice352]|uniref:PDR/VanB family oxidoreductase n=1 Tax=unclassified Tardiphaga TaxID=2631404 RepID=UPI001165C2BA|nr:MULTISPECIES: PDR/VanB family oxidoreductase [unclassified Tardiphaga]QDM16218.1 oxidoreductase [Tardiphaga sp. vice278]QDM21243.1 oxidoreductase [Tardiphaga sp. vice154]QDM31493.1 oxidoreductase [Tardiphaga sp. vice352]
MRFAEHWTGCRVAATRDVTPGIREITLRPDAPVASYPPGSHINVSLLIDGQPQTRSYSLVGERQPDSLRIAVRLAPDSRGGSRAMWALQPGARLEISSPSSLFDIDWTRNHYCLIAGGIGITPITGIAAVLRPRAGIDMQLHYAMTSRKDAAYLDELSGLLGERLHVHASDEGHRLDLAATFDALPADAIAILCGPMRMLEAARRAWNDAGRAPADLRYETFGSSGLLPTAEFRVRLKGSGEEIVVPANRSMLAALNDAGFEVMSDCERGECGVCSIDVLAVDGEIDHRDVFFSDHQKQGNTKICPCVSRAVGTVTVDTLYRPDAM